MDKNTALALAHRNAATEFTSAKAARHQALNHLESLIARMKSETEQGYYYSELNMVKAAADVAREQERLNAAQKQMGFIDSLLKND